LTLKYSPTCSSEFFLHLGFIPDEIPNDASRLKLSLPKCNYFPNQPVTALNRFFSSWIRLEDRSSPPLADQIAFQNRKRARFARSCQLHPRFSHVRRTRQG